MLRRCTSLRDSQMLERSFFSKNPWMFSLLQFSDVATKKGKVTPLQERKMRDRVRLWVKGGEGGNGCWSLRRSRTDRFGKADGGSGGRGGDVILECSAAVWDFRNLQHHLNARKGGNGASKNMIGSRGSDKVVQVPVGTVIHLVTGEIPSFVENTSTRPLQPWEIPDSEEPDPSESLHDSNSISVPNPLDREDPNKQVKYYGENSARFHSNAPKTLDLEATEGRENVKNRRLKCQEYNEDKYGTDLEVEENEEEGEDEYEEEEDVDEYEKEEEEEVQYSVAELTIPGQRLVVARGGDGGLGNVAAVKREPKDSKPHKTVKPKNDDTVQTEEFEDKDNKPSLNTGRPGSESILILELKSIADVGLVGMPNAGKSTLLGTISRAKPAVGHYAFTTLRPNIGNMKYDDFFSVTVADIPGLIKGAHANRGLGHAFLRHIERTKVLAYVVDLAAGLNGGKGIPPWEQLRDLVMELEYHQEGLSRRPSLVVANKIDEEGAGDVCEELKRRVKEVPIFPVCAVLEEGVPELKVGLRRLMDGSETQFLDPDQIMVD